MAKSKVLYKKATIVGVGLMGGSLGMALKKKGLAGKVVGWGRNERKLNSARKLKAIDSWTLDRREALKGADLLVFATPTSITDRLAPEWFAEAPAGCLITDLGSVKGETVRKLTGLTPPSRFYVSSHPLCGSEKTGVAAARPDLFEKHLCILTPVAGTKKRALGDLQKLWQSLGMKVSSMAPARHDRIMAAISHFPHLVASALVNQVGDEQLLDYVGTGFLDTTRIAAGSPTLWSEIVLQNRKEIISELDRWLKGSKELRKLLTSNNSAGLELWLRRAKTRRQKLAAPAKK